MTQIHTLSAADEIRLGRSIEAGLLAAKLLANRDVALATSAELQQVRDDGQSAWQQFLLANVRLVQSVAGPAARHSLVSAHELFQEGFVGLAEALLRWDHAAGFRFSTYAMPWIRRRVGDAAAAGVAVPASVGTAVRARRIRSLADELTSELNREVSDAEIAAVVGRSTDWVHRMRVMQSVAPLESDVLAVAEPELDDPQLRGLLGWLPAFERRVVTLRFGFDGSAGMNQRDVAEIVDVSLSTVRRAEARALRRLRGWLLDEVAA